MMRCLLLLVLGAAIGSAQCDDSPGFFLKISKNVPRLGRRSDSRFLNNVKTIPRIGRSDVSMSTQQFYEWLNDAPPSFSKRMYTAPTMTPEYSVVQPINANALIALLNQNALPINSIRFVHWLDFDRALQSDGDLFMKVSLLGRKPDDSLKEDLSNNLSNNIMQKAINKAYYGSKDLYNGVNEDKDDRYVGFNYI